MQLFLNNNHETLKNALLCYYGDIDKTFNYILDSKHQNDDQELDAVQGMLHLSTTI